MSTCFSEKFDQESNDLESTITKKYIKMKKLLSWMNNFGFAKISGSGSSVFVKIADLKEAQFIDEKKPIDLKSFIVKGLSKHPFYDVLS
jgi:4-diphosphocytidyl-2-C-methyl-D-erythritol kinase